MVLLSPQSFIWSSNMYWAQTHRGGQRTIKSFKELTVGSRTKQLQKSKLESGIKHRVFVSQNSMVCGDLERGNQWGLDKLGNIHGKDGNWNVNGGYWLEHSKKGWQISSLEMSHEKGIWGKERKKACIRIWKP